MRIIFKVTTRYGYHMADTLQDAKSTSKDGDQISIVAAGSPNDESLSTRARKYANMSWVLSFIRKHPDFTAVFYY